MKLKKITKAEFMALSKEEENYFQNGVIFDWINDNVIAFEDIEGEKFTYWKVQREGYKE